MFCSHPPLKNSTYRNLASCSKCRFFLTSSSVFLKFYKNVIEKILYDYEDKTIEIGWAASYMLPKKNARKRAKISLFSTFWLKSLVLQNRFCSSSNSTSHGKKCIETENYSSYPVHTDRRTFFLRCSLLCYCKLTVTNLKDPSTVWCGFKCHQLK